MSKNIKGYAAIERIATQHKKSPEQMKAEIEQTIEIAWSNKDPAVKTMQTKLFPHGKPTAEEFISTIATYIKNQH